MLIYTYSNHPGFSGFIFSTGTLAFSLANPDFLELPAAAPFLAGSAALLVFILAQLWKMGRAKQGPTALKGNTEIRQTYVLVTDLGSGWIFHTCLLGVQTIS